MTEAAVSYRVGRAMGHRAWFSRCPLSRENAVPECQLWSRRGHWLALSKHWLSLTGAGPAGWDTSACRTSCCVKKTIWSSHELLPLDFRWHSGLL